MPVDTISPLASAEELAALNVSRYPNESPAYRRARNALLAAEIDLRRHIERVAAQRRALPLGGPVPFDYTFIGEHGNPISLSSLFGGKDTLVLYSYMFGPARQRPCPMCASLLSAWEGIAASAAQRIALGVVARSPINRLLDWKSERGWRNLQLYSDTAGDYTRTYVSHDDADVPALNVFALRNGTVHHFWSAEMSQAMSDPGQDPRGAPDLDPLWTLFDHTPIGRGDTWYPKLNY